MATPVDRKARERAQREVKIIDAATDLAEAEGWSAVTTRRLAELIEYTPPVLYGHFPEGIAGIVNAVAIRGSGQFADVIEHATAAACGEGERVRSVVNAYLSFADEHPATYQAMFSMDIATRFADESTPEPLRRAFAVLAAALPPGDDNGTRTEVLWATLHGLATLGRDHRIPPWAAQDRIDTVVALFRAPGPR